MDWSWLNFVVFWVAVMSGALSIFREAVQIFPPGRITKKLQKSLFWRCVWIAFVVSAVWSWIVERNARIAAEHEIDRFEISMRPYVGVEKVKLLKGLHVGEQIQIQAQFRNSGKTPAIGVVDVEDTVFGDKSIPPRFDMPTITGDPVDIPPDNYKTMIFMGDIVSQAMLDEISKGTKTIYFYGEMEYRNTYSSKIYSEPTFCYTYDADIPENFLGSCGSPTFNRPKKNSK